MVFCLFVYDFVQKSHCLYMHTLSYSEGYAVYIPDVMFSSLDKHSLFSASSSHMTSHIWTDSICTRFWHEVCFLAIKYIYIFEITKNTTSHFRIATDLWSHYKLNIITVWREWSELVAHVTLPLSFPECHADLMKGMTLHVVPSILHSNLTSKYLSYAELLLMSPFTSVVP